MLNLENLEIGHFYKKSGKTWNSQGVSLFFFQVREKSGKTNYLVSISFSLILCMVFRKFVALFVVSECELHSFAL